jgi:hypothetical protein
MYKNKILKDTRSNIWWYSIMRVSAGKRKRKKPGIIRFNKVAHKIE